MAASVALNGASSIMAAYMERQPISGLWAIRRFPGLRTRPWVSRTLKMGIDKAVTHTSTWSVCVLYARGVGQVPNLPDGHRPGGHHLRGGVGRLWTRHPVAASGSHLFVCGSWWLLDAA